MRDANDRCLVASSNPNRCLSCRGETEVVQVITWTSKTELTLLLEVTKVVCYGSDSERDT